MEVPFGRTVLAACEGVRTNGEDDERRYVTGHDAQSRVTEKRRCKVLERTSSRSSDSTRKNHWKAIEEQ